ncbi:MAG: hypothetical protein AAF411_00215 [Myxococcota bacterium]
MPSFIRLAVSMVLLSGAGCANDETTFETELLLPARPASFDALFLRVSVRPTLAFEEDWTNSLLPDLIELTNEPQTHTFSVVSGNDPADLGLKLEFCEDADCEAEECIVGDERCGLARPEDPIGEVWIGVETPFYEGQTTRLSVALPLLPGCLDALCSEFTDPAVFADSSRAEERQLDMLCDLDGSFPRAVWRCTVPRCSVGCVSAPNVGSEGSCTEDMGRSGPHLCEAALEP